MSRNRNRGDDVRTYDYARGDWIFADHMRRYKAYVQEHGLVCQECGGSGGEVVPVLDTGEGPFEECGWCEGTGRVTRWTRGLWLRCQQKERK